MNIKNVKYITELKKLGYPLNEMLVIGSGTMTLYGLKENTDLDLWVTHRLYKRMSYDKRLHKDVRGMLKTKNDEIECHFLLPCSHGSIEENLKRAVVVDGVHFMSLKDVIAWKKCIGRPKDYEHIKMIEKYIRKNNLVENYLQSIQEGYIFSDKTISIDLDKFISGEKNKLLIAGLSGSGKTTFCKYFANKNNIECFATDECLDYMREIPNFREILVDEKQLKKYFYEAYLNCIRPQLINNKRQVIEGGAVWQNYIYKPETRLEINKHPIIIFGSSALKATIGAMERRIKKSNITVSKILSILNTNFNFLNSRLKIFREERIKAGGDIKEFVIPKDIIEA